MLLLARPWRWLYIACGCPATMCCSCQTVYTTWGRYREVWLCVCCRAGLSSSSSWSRVPAHSARYILCSTITDLGSSLLDVWPHCCKWSWPAEWQDGGKPIAQRFIAMMREWPDRRQAASLLLKSFVSISSSSRLHLVKHFSDQWVDNYTGFLLHITVPLCAPHHHGRLWLFAGRCRNGYWVLSEARPIQAGQHGGVDWCSQSGILLDEYCHGQSYRHVFIQQFPQQHRQVCCNMEWWVNL